VTASGSARAAPLPAVQTLAAPAHWRAIDFISDLHLSAAMPATHAAWRDYLARSSADAVVILGDLFELWVGDDARALPFEQACVQVLARAAANKPVYFMAGNRDFLLGAPMLADAGLQGLADPTLLSAFGTSVLLSHGDALCLDDVPYQAFRQLVRSPSWQAEFLAKPLTERQRIASDIRAHSQSRRAFDGAASADVDKPVALAWLAQCDAAALVHGHTHRPGSEALDAVHTRHVLSDWDFDSHTRGEVLRWTAHGFTRLAPAQAHLQTP
jgi:UDP-2,3-diacylglucosamine hydrolase